MNEKDKDYLDHLENFKKELVVRLDHIKSNQRYLKDEMEFHAKALELNAEDFALTTKRLKDTEAEIKELRS